MAQPCRSSPLLTTPDGHVRQYLEPSRDGHDTRVPWFEGFCTRQSDWRAMRLNKQFRHRQFTAGNPLANVLVVIGGIIIIAISLALGFFFFLGMAGFVLLMAAIMTVRSWWNRRQFGRKSPPEQEIRRETTVRRQIIEGEYREVGQSRRDPPDP